MITNGIHETQSSVAVACFLPGRAKDLSAHQYKLTVRYAFHSALANTKTQT
jgi:hypothetical protein